MAIALATVTSILALLFAVALVDQWRERRRPFQLVWAVGMAFYGIAAGLEAVGESAGWSDTIVRGWFVLGVATPAWLGLGTAFLLNRTRFGYTYGLLVALGALLAYVVRTRYPEAGPLPVVVLFLGLGFGLAIAIETYFQNERWPAIGAIAVGLVTLAEFALTATLPLRGVLTGAEQTLGSITEVMPHASRVLALPLTITGALALVLGALFSLYVFMPKRRVLAYSLDPGQRGDEFLFNLLIAPVAIVVNLVASLPGAASALLTGRIHSRVPATFLIAIGAFVPTVADSLHVAPSLGRLIGVVFLFAGFLVSIEAFGEIRIPFTSIRLATARHERVAADR
ncbi:MAG TPA: hypothetical protein VH723_02940 [Candidatus Limnocylindrales bacterium]